ncbi:endonuclease domain-containing protein [Aequorivita viscosa]|nr:endonuclease domain-containing protein [Aequorivita viscosa]
MRKKKIHDKPEMRAYRRELRNNATPAEAFLWKYLKGSQLGGRKFRRQHSIHNYIVDFYCASEGLIVELDGQVHMDASAEEYDRKREAVLKGLGFVIVRFENKMVFDFLPSVLKDIRDHFKVNRK